MEADLQQLNTAPHPWSKWSAISIAIVTVIVIVGWIARISALVTFLPDGAPMVMNTALCLLLSSAGLFAARGKRYTTTRACAAAVLLVSGLTLLEHAEIASI